MVEAQIRELVTAVQTVQAPLTASETAWTTLQAQVDRMGRASGERKIGVDKRNVGRPSQFSGTDSAWRDWSVVFRKNAALVHPALKEEMQRVERLPTAETNASLLENEQVQVSTDLLPFASAQHLGSSSGSCVERWVGRRTPCLAAVGRKVRPTHQVENSRATLEPDPIRLLWRHACEARVV